MRKLPFFFCASLLTFLFSCATLNQQKESSLNPNDIVRWTDSTKLSWDDFQGQPTKESKTGSDILIQSIATFHRSTFLTPASATVDCYVDKKASWVKKSQAKSQLLFYYQTLFDLYELYSQKLRKKLAETTFGFENSTGVFDSTYQAHTNDLSKAAAQYRSETGTGTKNKKIKEWSEKIANELKEPDKSTTP
jgi:hypothetical protein